MPGVLVGTMTVECPAHLLGFVGSEHPIRMKNLFSEFQMQFP